MVPIFGSPVLHRGAICEHRVLSQSGRGPLKLNTRAIWLATTHSGQEIRSHSSHLRPRTWPKLVYRRSQPAPRLSLSKTPVLIVPTSTPTIRHLRSNVDSSLASLSFLSPLTLLWLVTGHARSALTASLAHRISHFRPSLSTNQGIVIA